MGEPTKEVRQENIDLKDKEGQALSLANVWKRNRSIQRMMNKIKKLSGKPEMSEVLHGIISDDGLFQPLPAKLFDKTVKKKGVDPYAEPFVDFSSQLTDLQDSFGIEVSVKKSADGEYEFELGCNDPKYLAYRIKGQTLDNLGSGKNVSKFLSRAAKSGCPINEIAIDDITSSSDIRKGNESQFLEVLFELRNRISPTVIKYGWHAFKRFLIYIPSGLNMSSFIKAHGRELTKIHNDFYQKDYRGRPRSRHYREEEIRLFLKELKKKRDISGTSIVDLGSEVAEHLDMSSRTIERHYKSVIRKERDKKDKNSR